MPAADNRDLSIERAQQQAKQQMRFVDHSVLPELDGECQISIEVNGIPVGMVTCMDSAIAELAAGWALINRFCESPTDLDSVSAHDSRASLMVRGGIDILHRRSILLGERSESLRVPAPWPRGGDWTIHEDVLLDILREAWSLFRNDRMLEGSVHAALANETGIEVVAFDFTAQSAVAKVFGWSMRERRFPAAEILIVNGAVTSLMVDAAARVGVKIIASPNIPTADAYKLARVTGLGIVGYMRQGTVGLFGNPDLVHLEDSEGLTP